MKDEVIEIKKSELLNALSKIFSAIPDITQLKMSKLELVKIYDSLFNIQGKRRQIIPLQADTVSLRSDAAKDMLENRSFEYVTLEEAAEETGLNIKYLIRGALTANYLLYHYHAGWWPVPVMYLNDLYNGQEEVSSKIWSISNGDWLPIHVCYIEPLDTNWGKKKEAVEKVSLTIASLHIREDDLRRITNNPSLLEEDLYYKSDELELAVACSRELYPTKPPEASTPGERQTNARAENKRIKAWLQRNDLKEGSRLYERIRVMVNPYSS